MAREIIYEGKYKRFVIDDGWEFVERVNCGGIVAIFAMTDDRKVILVEQPRPPLGKQCIEPPSGLANDKEGCEDESLKEAANRELVEETGYRAQNLELILEGPTSSASSSDLIHFYLATGLEKIGEGGGDETEDIIVHEVLLDDVDEWLKSKISDKCTVEPKVYMGLYFLKRMGQ